MRPTLGGNDPHGVGKRGGEYSLDTEAIIGGDHRAVDEMALVRAQHHHQCIQILELSDTLAWQHVDEFLTRVRLPVAMVDLSIDISWTNSVHVDAEAAPFQGHGLGHLDHR